MYGFYDHAMCCPVCHHHIGELSVFTDFTLCSIFMGAIDGCFINCHYYEFNKMKLFKNNRGATAVEFALVALPVLLFMFGIMQTALPCVG